MSVRDLTKVRRLAVPLVLLFLSASLWGCALTGEQKKEPAPQAVPQAAEASLIAPPEPPKPEEPPLPSPPLTPDETGRAYQVCGKTHQAFLTAHGYEERGIASWSGPAFHGRHTSSGEVFDMYKPSAAHKLLPTHTQIIVTNLENGRSLTLYVNDRGPFVPGRVLDLSYAAAKSLAMVDRGMARILLRTSGPVEGQHGDDLSGEFFVHVGSFEAGSDALSLIGYMKSLGYRASTLKVIRVERDNEIRWRVEVGPYQSLSEAEKAQCRVVKDYPSAFVVAKE